MVSGTDERVELKKQAAERVKLSNINWGPNAPTPENTMWAIEGLTLDPDNARDHSEENIRAIKASLKRFGQQKPIVADATGLVIAGNGTVIAAQELGWNNIWVSVSELEGEDAANYAVADNRSAELALWNDEMLSKRLQNMEIAEKSLFDDLGFDSDDVLEPNLEELKVDLDEFDLDPAGLLAEGLIVLRIQLPQGQEHTNPARQEIQAVCDKYGLVLEARIQT